MRAIDGCLALALVFALSVGCEPSEDPAVVSARQKLVVATEPSGAIGLTQLAEKLETQEDATTAVPVTLVGRINAGQLEPWEPGKASFVLSELPPEGHGEGHDADNCPFCKRKLAKAPTGIVRFADDQGDTLAIDARTLFQIDKDQTVVIAGTATAGELNSILVNADKIYIRR